MFFIWLYLLAFALGGHKPCVQAFCAAQLDADDPEEHKAKSSFFNWWYFGLCVGPIVGILVLNYIQDILSWVLGFGIPCIIMCFSLMVFLFGTFTYWFAKKIEDINALVRIGQVFVNTVHNWQTPSEITAQEQACGTFPSQDSQQFRFLNKALLSPDGSNEVGTFCSMDVVDEVKLVLRLVPIWVTCLGAITRRPSGITMLQRIGTGIFISVVSMVVAAIIETKRLKMASEYGLVDKPGAVVPMKIWWLLLQYLLAGASEVFTIVGIQEFF